MKWQRDTLFALFVAIGNGAVVGQEVSEFMGTKYAEFTDPFGYTWTINQLFEKSLMKSAINFTWSNMRAKQNRGFLICGISISTISQKNSNLSVFMSIMRNKCWHLF